MPAGLREHLLLQLIVYTITGEEGMFVTTE
jgi:hypothetical protein